MSQRVVDIRKHSFSEDDRLLVDANVWLSVYGPLAQRRRRIDIYSKALREMRTQRSHVYLDVLVLSEFINAFARLVYNQLPPDKKASGFKTFRNGDRFGDVACEIAASAKKITCIATRCDSGFELVDIGAILTAYGEGGQDFNDQVLAELCRRNELTLVTDDADFQGANVPILTANHRMLV